jgi:hypothetical protein
LEDGTVVCSNSKRYLLVTAGATQPGKKACCYPVVNGKASRVTDLVLEQ